MPEAKAGQPYAVLLHSDDRKIVRKIEKEAFNRIRSIEEDSRWVVQVAKALPELPLIANLRCGAWYLSPDLPQSSRAPTFCYFKSTDGHTNEWSFSLKRPNLDVVRLIQERGGVIITDSTRRGKSMPDALSKTIPIFCAVVTEASRRKYGQSSSIASQEADRTLHPFREANVGSRMGLRTPLHQASPSEHAQIEARIDGWVEQLLASDLQIPRLSKPLVPFFLTRSEDHSEADLLESLRQAALPRDVHPVILLSASRRVTLPVPDPTGSYYYTQGSGDDEELWSFGLTPEIFWSSKHHETIMSASREALTDTIRRVVEDWQIVGRSVSNGNTSAKDQDNDDETALDVQIGATNIFCGRRSASQGFTAEDKHRYGLLIRADVGPGQKTTEEQKEKDAAILLQLGLTQGKKGLVEFRSKLPQVLRAAKQVSTSSHESSRILIVEQRPQDLSFAIAVAILSTLYDSSQELVPTDDFEEHGDSLSKEDIRKRLQWVVQAIPNANPSRAHLLRINEVLISNRVKETLRMQDMADDQELSQRLGGQTL